MKSIWKFVKTTITGGLLFLIPVVLVLIVLNRAFEWIRPWLRPLVVALGVDSMLGVTVLTALCLLALGFICFIAGLVIKLDRNRKIRKGFEDIVLKFLPGFEYLKVMAGEVDGTDVGQSWKAGLLADGDAWVIAFVVEQHDNGRTTVFVPESPRADSGNTKIIETATMQFHPIGMREAYAALRHYGAGMGSKLPMLKK
jgi:uncharacterized membrane protein